MGGTYPGGSTGGTAAVGTAGGFRFGPPPVGAIIRTPQGRFFFVPNPALAPVPTAPVRPPSGPLAMIPRIAGPAARAALLSPPGRAFRLGWDAVNFALDLAEGYQPNDAIAPVGGAAYLFEPYWDQVCSVSGSPTRLFGTANSCSLFGYPNPIGLVNVLKSEEGGVAESATHYHFMLLHPNSETATTVEGWITQAYALAKTEPFRHPVYPLGREAPWADLWFGPEPEPAPGPLPSPPPVWPVREVGPVAAAAPPIRPPTPAYVAVPRRPPPPRTVEKKSVAIGPVQRLIRGAFYWLTEAGDFADGVSKGLPGGGWPAINARVNNPRGVRGPGIWKPEKGSLYWQYKQLSGLHNKIAFLVEHAQEIDAAMATWGIAIEFVVDAPFGVLNRTGTRPLGPIPVGMGYGLGMH